MRFLTKKQRVLLELINELGKKNMSSKLGIEKALFVLKKKERMDECLKFYSFFPYKLGPYSYVSYRDIAQLESGGYLAAGGKSLTEKGMEAIKKVDSKVAAKIRGVVDRFGSDIDIKDHVYSKYPDYTVKSRLISHEEKRKAPCIFSIGYEGRDIDSFLDIMIKNGIDTLIDVRSNPFSMNFSFTKGRLVHYLGNSEIKYVGVPELGIKGEMRKGLSSVQDYKRLFEMYERTTLLEQHKKIREIMELGKTERVALMCFESDKDMCHRGVISSFIEKQGIGVSHL